MKKILLMTMIAVMAAMLAGCGGADIATVKSGYLEAYKTVTLGDGFNSILENPSWTTLKTDRNQTVVQVSGKLKPGCPIYKNLEALQGVLVVPEKFFIVEGRNTMLTAQFVINKDGRTFAIGAVGCRLEGAPADLLFGDELVEGFYSDLLK